MEFHTDIEIDASADEAWQVLGEQFGDIAEWSATLATSHLVGDLGVGATRSCEGTGFGPFPPGVVTEKLTLFDRQARALTYEANTGLPPFVLTAMNRWTIESLGPERCRVHSHATVQLAWWARPLGFLMPWMMRGDMDRFSEEMRHRIERGVAHPRAAAK